MVELVELSSGRAGLAGPGRVVPAELARSLLRIEALRAAAERDSREMLEAARAEVDRIRAEAREAGLAEAASEIQDRLFEIAEASVNVIARTEERIVDLALQIARRILGEFDEAEATARIAAHGLKLAAHSSFVRLRVAPAVAGAMDARLSDIIGTRMPLSAVEVVADPRVRDGGCVLETDAGLIDASVESQLAAIERGLRRSLARSEAGA